MSNDSRSDIRNDNVFSDEDLIAFTHKYGHLTHCAALLHRLEAAEFGFTQYHGLEMWKGCSCRCCKGWLKSKGEGGAGQQKTPNGQ